MDKVTRAELSEIIGRLRVKAEKYKDREIAEIANRLICVHNIGLPSTGHLTHVQCLRDWVITEGFDSVNQMINQTGWPRTAMTKFAKDVNMELHAVIDGKVYRRYEKSPR